MGKPGLPVFSGVRGHNCSIMLADALDHDFVVPSVVFAVKIPDSPKDAFYHGKAFVALKDKVTQPSSPCYRVAAFGDDTIATKLILVTVSDGGPDHHITFVILNVPVYVIRS